MALTQFFVRLVANLWYFIRRHFYRVRYCQRRVTARRHSRSGIESMQQPLLSSGNKGFTPLEGERKVFVFPAIPRGRPRHYTETVLLLDTQRLRELRKNQTLEVRSARLASQV